MRITERDLRRLVREMALKGINIARAQQMDDETSGGLYRSPDAEGIFQPRDEFESLLPNKFSADDFYRASVRTWGRDSYKSYAARQFERFPVGLNIFLVPGAKGFEHYGEVVDGRFTELDDPRMNEKGLEFIRRHFPDVQIDADDFNIVLLTGRALPILNLQSPDSIDTSKDPVAPPRSFLDDQGVYNTFHALFDGGILQNLSVSNLGEEVCNIVAGTGDVESLLMMGAGSALNQIFRLRTLKMKRITNVEEVGNELATVALIRQTIPVNTENFPTHDMNGVEIPEDARAEGIKFVNIIARKLELARDAWRILSGKTIIGSPT